MKKSTLIYQLSTHFNLEHMATETAQFLSESWIPHAQEGAGDASLPLISVGGMHNIDYAISGPMQPTQYLEQCPYLQQVLQQVSQRCGSPLSRCRLVRQIVECGDAKIHPINTDLVTDLNYHWFRRNPTYIPIIADTTVTFAHGEQHLHMAHGEAWTFDPRTPHGFIHTANHTTIHLVIEAKDSNDQTAKLAQGEQLLLEPYRFEVLTPQEIRDLMANLLAEVQNSQASQDELTKLTQRVETFQRQWQQTFDRFGHQSAGELAYQDLLLDFQEQIVHKARKWAGSGGKYALTVIRSMLQTAPNPPKRLQKQLGRRLHLRRQKKNAQALSQQETFCSPEFDRPLFIVSAPRAGSTLLFETLRHFPDLWSIGEESHELIEDIPSLHPAVHNYHSNRLTAIDAMSEIIDMLRQRFAQQLQNREGKMYVESPTDRRPTSIRFLEKTPKNALRIPFIKAIFPEALFLFLYREPAENISSMIEGWRSRRFIAYRPLPGWPYRDWSFLLVPGWQKSIHRPLVEIAAYQWQMANMTILQDLEALPRSDWSLVCYTDLVQQPKHTIHRIAQFAGLQWDKQVEQRVSQALPVSSMTMSAPSAEKWRKNAWLLTDILPSLESTISNQVALINATDQTDRPAN